MNSVVKAKQRIFLILPLKKIEPMSNKILLAIFATLLAIFGLSQVFSGKGDRSFQPEIIEVDSAKVTSIVIRAKADSLAEFTLKKEPSGWTATKGTLSLPANEEAIGQLLSNLTLVKSTQIAAKSKEKWPLFEVEEDKASHLTAFAGSKKVADFFIGKFSVNQQARQITTYFRLAEGEEVYAVEGMAGMMFGQGFRGYRNKQFLKFDPISAVEELSFEGDAACSVKKSGGNWLLDGTTPVDTASVRDYLMNLREMNGDEFIEDFQPAANAGKLYKKLTIKGLPEPVIIQCWRDTAWEKPFVLQSNQFPDAYFASDTSRLFKRVFKPVKEW